MRKNLFLMMRKKWIDWLRGVCMIAIVWDHTEIYYVGDNVIPYNLYVPNALCLFFILSGYLMNKGEADEKAMLFVRLKSIFRGLVMPYFIFTTAMAVPKALTNGYVLGDVFVGILTGEASWFVACLAVAELMFALVLRISKGRMAMLAATGTLSLAMSMMLSGHDNLWWHTDKAFLALSLLCVGYAFNSYEDRLMPWLQRPVILIFIAAGVALMKWTEWHFDLKMLVFPLNIDHFSVFMADILLSAGFLIVVAKRLGRCAMVEWTGAHSIVYYFFAGGVPLLTSRLLNGVGMAYDGRYWRIVVAATVVYAVATLLTWIIYKYIPFVTGRRLAQK